MKEFNVVGVCSPDIDYMVNIEKKLEIIFNMIKKGQYFTINKARQYGKTTTLSLINIGLSEEYLVLKISFEKLGDSSFVNEATFIKAFINLITKQLKLKKVKSELIINWEGEKSLELSFEDLSDKITYLIDNSEKEIVLLIDEVDKSSDNKIFINFLSMLRGKYLDRKSDNISTFKSVVLAGVHDVKNLKNKIEDSKELIYNSPWNIASNFEVDMDFNAVEIGSMLREYCEENLFDMNINDISLEIYKYTSGYPFLVSLLCKIIDEKLGKNWTTEGVGESVRIALKENNTLFESVIKNIENNSEFSKFIYNILIEGYEFSYIFSDRIISLGAMYGIFKESDSKVRIHNSIFETIIYNHYAINKERLDINLKNYERVSFLDSKGDL